MIALQKTVRAKTMPLNCAGRVPSASPVVFSAESVLWMVSMWRTFVLSSFVQLVGNRHRSVKRSKIFSLVRLMQLLRSLFLHAMARDCRDIPWFSYVVRFAIGL